MKFDCYYVVEMPNGTLCKPYKVYSDSPKLYVHKGVAENIAKKRGGRVLKVMLKEVSLQGSPDVVSSTDVKATWDLYDN